MATNFDLTKPDDHSLNPTWPREVRELKQLLLSRLYLTASEPSARPDTTDFEANDNGSFWIDSDDNHVYILTDYSGPTWVDFETVIEAMTLIMASADCTFTLQNTDEEDTDGGRQSSLRFKGEQSGGEVTTLAAIEASHDGSSDDQKGQLKIAVNDGDDDDTPSKVALTISSDGKIVVAESLLFLDEDDMATDSAVQAPTQQSVKAFAEPKILTQATAGLFGPRTANDTTPAALVKDVVYLAQCDGTITLYRAHSGTDSVETGYTDSSNPPTTVVRARTTSSLTYKQGGFSMQVIKGEYVKLTCNGITPTIYWLTF